MYHDLAVGHSDQGQVNSLFAWKNSMTADAGRSAIDPNPGMLCPELTFSCVLAGICKASGAEMLFHPTKIPNPDSPSSPTIPWQPDCSGMLT